MNQENQYGVQSQPKHIPSPEEIAMKCAELRRSWPESRLNLRYGYRYQPVTVSAVQSGIGVRRKQKSSESNRSD